MPHNPEVLKEVTSLIRPNSLPMEQGKSRDWDRRCRETKRLIINIPLRTLKPHCVSVVAFPAWVLAVGPESKILCIAGHRSPRIWTRRIS